MAYQHFACADSPSHVVVGLRCMCCPTLAAEFDMVCTDYRILAGNCGKLASNDAEIGYPIVMQVVTLLQPAVSRCRQACASDV